MRQALVLAVAITVVLLAAAPGGVNSQCSFSEQHPVSGSVRFAVGYDWIGTDIGTATAANPQACLTYCSGLANPSFYSLGGTTCACKAASPIPTASASASRKSGPVGTTLTIPDGTVINVYCPTGYSPAQNSYSCVGTAFSGTLPSCTPICSPQCISSQGSCTAPNTCTCNAGYTGNRCQTEINECASNPCMNGGVCTDLVNKYTCACNEPYYGHRCEAMYPPVRID